MLTAWRDLGKLPKELWVVSISLLINRVGTMALPFLVLYLTRRMGYPAQRAGFVLACYGFAALGANPLGGWLCDRLGALHVMLVSLVVSALLLFVYPLAHSYEALVLLTLVWGAVSEVCRPATMTLTSELAAPHQRKSAFALNRLAVNLGMSIGPALGGFLARSSFAALFILDGATNILGALLVWYYLLRRWQGTREYRPPAGGVSIFTAMRTGVSDRRFLYFLVAVMPVQVVFFQHSSTMALHLVRNLGYSEAAYGALFTLNTLLITLVEIPLNAATARWPHGRCLSLGAVLFGIGFGALAVARSTWEIALTVITWTVGEMILFPQSSAYVSDISPASQRGNYMGLYMTGFSVAFVIGPWLGTYLLESKGPTILWGLNLVWGLLSAVLLWRVTEPPTPSTAAGG